MLRVAPRLRTSTQIMHTLRELPKSSVFTTSLPADAAFPTPADSHKAPRDTLGPRMVREALFTYVRPDPQGEPELLAVSPRALHDIGLKASEAKTDEFRDVVAGRTLLTWDESLAGEGIIDMNVDNKKGNTGNGIYPWAQCYGGYQFGQWAGQLGDGRAISLFETTNPSTGIRHELQLKGAGRTPYSRFADGRAVLRSSIREFVVSESLHALGIPTTRALALTLNRGSNVRRERIEPGATVTRFAQSWLRLGTFDLQHVRGDRQTLRTLADYTAEQVYGGWDQLPSALPDQNRYARLYRAISRRNALTVAAWQAYGFLNGVLNTDNTSVLGLSIDFGPFAFLDTFDPAYTPNHDDHMLRYSYRNQPSIIWWNLVRLGEALGELIGAGPTVDDPVFIAQGVTEAAAPDIIKRAETVIDGTAEEYKAVFLAEYKRLMTLRFGLLTQQDSDFNSLMSEWLDCLEKYELDFHHAFRRLSSIQLADLATEEQRKDVAARFFKVEDAATVQDEARVRLAKWLDTWAQRIRQDWGHEPTKEPERIQAMKKVNPNFVPRSWILDELITRVEKQGEREVLPQIMKMALSPFEDGWATESAEGGLSLAEQQRYTGDVPRFKEMMQCSCSS